MPSEREPRLGFTAQAGRSNGHDPRPLARPSRPDSPRERRLRARIDGLWAQRAAKERRILALEDALREQLRRNVQLRADLREARDG